MKTTSWCVGLLIGFVVLSTSHSESALALTPEETACVAQLYVDKDDPTKCIKISADGGSSGSGGSDSASGSGSTSGGGSSHSVLSGFRPSSCSPPSWWPMGPLDPLLVEEFDDLDIDPATGTPTLYTNITFVKRFDGSNVTFMRESSESLGLTKWTWSGDDDSGVGKEFSCSE